MRTFLLNLDQKSKTLDPFIDSYNASGNDNDNYDNNVNDNSDDGHDDDNNNNKIITLTAFQLSELM